MGEVLTGVVRLLVQAVLLVAGLVVALSLFVAGALLVVVFGLRLLWARVTGRPVTMAFGAGVDPASAWRRYKGWQTRAAGAAAARPGHPGRRLPAQDVQDVEPKEPGGPQR